MRKNKCSFKNGHESYNFKNEIGNIYGKLKVINRVSNSKFGTTRWNCLCECGNMIETSAQSLRTGQTKSCGCLIYEVNNSRRKGDAVARKLFQSIKTYSLKKNLPFDLTLEDVKELGYSNCTYCGRVPYIEKAAYMRSRYSMGINTDEISLINGIDKVIPKLGYVKSNCVPCCKYCNRAKSDLSVEEFKNLITLIYNNYVRT